MRKGPQGGTRAAIGVIATVLAGPAAAFADETRITVGFRPAQPQSPFTVEITNAGPHHVLPSLRLSGNRSGIQLAGYNTLLPLVAVRGLSVAPRYGDHGLAFDFQPSALAGMGLSLRSVRGLTLAATGKRVSGTLLAGQLVSGSSMSPFGSAVPQVLAFSATIKPQPRVAISPRLVAPLSRRSAQGGADSTMGIGMRAEVSRHISIIGDAGSTRTRDRRWAQSATAGALGRWSRVSVEASASHGDEGVTLLGSVPFAGSDRKVASGHVQMFKDVAVDGQFSATNPVGRQLDRTVGRSATLHFDRLRYGNLLLHFDRSSSRIQHPHSLTVEWRRRGASGMTIQLQQRGDGRNSSGDARRLQMEVPNIHAGKRLLLGVRSSLLLSKMPPGQSRIAMRLKGRLAAGAHLGLTSEADFDALGSAARRLHSISSGTDITLSRTTSVLLAHVYTPGSRRSPWKQLDVRFARSISSK